MNHFLSVPDKCRNLRVLDATWESITIQWEAPSLINGELQGYVLQYHALFCSDPEYHIEKDGKRCSSMVPPHKAKTQPPLPPPRKQNENLKMFAKNHDTEQARNDTLKQNSKSFAKANVLPTVVEGPLVEEMVYVGGHIDKVTHKIMPLFEFTVYRIIIRAKNSAGRGPAVAVVGATVAAPRTTAVIATTDVSTTALTTSISVTEAAIDYANSTLIAATTAGAIFITLIILLVAISKWIRVKGAKHEAKNFHIPDSPIIPKSFHSSDTLDGVVTRRTDLPTSSCEPLARMTSFIGSTERLQQAKDKSIPAKYSFRNYKRRPSQNLSDSDTEFEYAVIREGFKAFGEGLSRQRETVGLYAQSDNPHRRQDNEQSLRTRNHATSRLGNEDSSATANPHKSDVLFKHSYNGPYLYGQFNQNDNNRSHELPGDRLSGNWLFDEDDTYL